MADEFDIARAALETALAEGADYADVRLNRVRNERLAVRNGRLEEASESLDSGLGVRVLKDGVWGFGAVSCDLGAPALGALREAAARAVALARALRSSQREPVRLAPQAGLELDWQTPLEQDPFQVALSQKVELLRSADAALSGAPETVVREAQSDAREEEQWQVSSEGARIHQRLVRTGAGIATTAAAHGQVQRRSYPASFGGNYQSRGWEHVLGLELEREAPRVRDEAVALCFAPPVPAGRHDLILGGSQLMLQIHESVGHPNELDRVLGHEVDLAGGSFATPEKLGRFQYGSEIVQLVADSTVPGGLDTRAADDDGVPSGRWDVVRHGIFQGYHTNREWAARAGDAASRGTCRAESWYHPPIIRITNLSLEPGTWTLEELIADTGDGIFCDTVRMWSIDQQRLNFQFTTEIGWEIAGGRRTRMLRNPTYQGTTPEFWRSCDAICNADHWQLWGVPNCGKGNPMQVAEMSHGCAPARFRGVTFL